MAIIYIRFNQIFDEKSYISATIEAVKHLHAFFLLTAEHRRRPSDCKGPSWFILASLKPRDSMMLLEGKVNCVPMVYYRAFP